MGEMKLVVKKKPILKSTLDNPLLIFPAEIWDIILKYIQDPQTLHNIALSTTHECFQDLLKSRKISYLFHLSLPILCNGQQDWLSSGHNSDEIFKLRKLSHSWKNGVDTHLLNSPCVSRLEDNNDHLIYYHGHDQSERPQRCWQNQNSVRFHEPENLRAFETFMTKYTGTCPFITRTLFIGDHLHHRMDIVDLNPQHQMKSFPDCHNYQFEETTRMWSMTLSLLSKYGDSIHNFEFFSTAKRSGPNYYIVLLQALALLPNLTKLQITFDVQPGHILNERCLHLINSFPIPRLANLKSLKLTNVPSVLINAYLTKFKTQLENLSVVLPQTHSHLYTFGDEVITFENLEYLCTPVPNEHFLWRLEKSPWFNNLKTLILKDMRHSFLYCGMEKLFKVISNISLRNLHLELCALEDDYSDEGREMVGVKPRLRLNSKSIKKLTIVSKSYLLNSLDFILGMVETLEELCIVLHQQNWENENQLDTTTWNLFMVEEHKYKRTREGKEKEESYGILQFLGYWRKMYESNIWRIMPKLNSTTIQTRGFKWDVLLDFDNNHNHSQASQAVYDRTGLAKYQQAKRNEAEEEVEMKYIPVESLVMERRK